MPKNPRITKKEMGLLKGALRRVFSRSELRQKAVEAIRIDYTDSNRPRVKKWARCPLCKNPTPAYLVTVDHINPIIPVDSSFERMTLDDVLDNMWCAPEGLQAICPTCHTDKSSRERKQRTFNKRKKS